jgi:hypothetical protein
MKNGTKSPDDKKHKMKKQKEANDNAPMAKAPMSEAKTVSEAKPVMRVQAAAPMPQQKAAVAAKPLRLVKAAPAPKAEVKVKTAVKAAPKTETKAAPKAEAKAASKSNGKSKRDVKKEAKKASKPAKAAPVAETVSLMSAFKPPFAVASFAMPKAMMPASLAEAGQDALAVNRKLVEMTQANMQAGLDFAMRLAAAKTPMEFMSLQMSYWQERMGAFARQAEELRALAGRSGR